MVRGHLLRLSLGDLLSGLDCSGRELGFFLSPLFIIFICNSHVVFELREQTVFFRMQLSEVFLELAKLFFNLVKRHSVLFSLDLTLLLKPSLDSVLFKLLFELFSFSQNMIL